MAYPDRYDDWEDESRAYDYGDEPRVNIPEIDAEVDKGLLRDGRFLTAAGIAGLVTAIAVRQLVKKKLQGDSDVSTDRP